MRDKSFASFLLVVAVSFYLDLGAVLDTEGHNSEKALGIGSSSVPYKVDRAPEIRCLLLRPLSGRTGRRRIVEDLHVRVLRSTISL